jgi:hypothetical protein
MGTMSLLARSSQYLNRKSAIEMMLPARPAIPAEG